MSQSGMIFSMTCYFTFAEVDDMELLFENSM